MLLKSTPLLFNSKFLQHFLSTSRFNVEFYSLYLLYQCLSLASSVTPCMEYLTDRIFNSSLKYYMFVWYYVCHTQI